MTDLYPVSLIRGSMSPDTVHEEYSPHNLIGYKGLNSHEGSDIPHPIAEVYILVVSQ